MTIIRALQGDHSQYFNLETINHNILENKIEIEHNNCA